MFNSGAETNTMDTALSQRVIMAMKHNERRCLLESELTETVLIVRKQRRATIIHNASSTPFFDESAASIHAKHHLLRTRRTANTLKRVDLMCCCRQKIFEKENGRTRSIGFMQLSNLSIWDENGRNADELTAALNAHVAYQIARLRSTRCTTSIFWDVCSDIYAM